MKEIIITNVIGNRDKSYNYFVDKKNNLCREKYSWFKDKTTYILILLIILGFLYYTETKTAKEFVGDSCVRTCLINRYVDNWNINNPTNQVVCDNKGSCKYSGIMNDQFKNFEKQLSSYNYTFNG